MTADEPIKYPALSDFDLHERDEIERRAMLAEAKRRFQERAKRGAVEFECEDRLL